MFWTKWPSIVVEMLSGLLTSLASVIVFDNILLRFALAQLLSVIYERYLDHNGFSWKDIAQRSVGIILGLIAYSLLGL